MQVIIKSMSILVLVVITGCAHKINLTPPLNTLDGEGFSSIEKNVGYFISEENRVKEVETPGGGGDKVKYTPYGDLEPALKHALSNVFSNVHAVPSINDSKFINENKISYVFIPTVTTNSSSPSLLTWPPTDFTIALQCRAIDEAGNEVWKTQIEGKGHAEFDQFKHDFSLAARKAVKEALLKLGSEISKTDVFK